MANQKISDLANAGALSGTELIETVQGGVNKKTTTQDIANLAGSSGHTIEDEGTPLTTRTKLNFVGAGVTVTDDSGDDATVVTIPGGGGTWGSITGTLSDQTDLQSALDGKRNIGVRADVTVANGITDIDWSDGSIQVLTLSETKVFDSISNPVVDEVITLILDGTQSVSFSSIDAVVEGSYNSGEENRVYIHCLKVAGGAEYRITFDNSLGGAGDGVEEFAALTDAATVAWAATKAVSNKTLTITDNRTFGVPSGVTSGWSGNVLVTASGAQRTISIPAGTSHKMKGVGDDTAKDIIIPSGETYLISWLYDGTNFWWWYVD